MTQSQSHFERRPKRDGLVYAIERAIETLDFIKGAKDKKYSVLLVDLLKTSIVVGKKFDMQPLSPLRKLGYRVVVATSLSLGKAIQMERISFEDQEEVEMFSDNDSTLLVLWAELAGTSKVSPAFHLIKRGICASMDMLKLIIEPIVDRKEMESSAEELHMVRTRIEISGYEKRSALISRLVDLVGSMKSFVTTLIKDNKLILSEVKKEEESEDEKVDIKKENGAAILPPTPSIEKENGARLGVRRKATTLLDPHLLKRTRANPSGGGEMTRCHEVMMAAFRNRTEREEVFQEEKVVTESVTLICKYCSRKSQFSTHDVVLFMQHLQSKHNANLLPQAQSIRCDCSYHVYDLERAEKHAKECPLTDCWQIVSFDRRLVRYLKKTDSRESSTE